MPPYKDPAVRKEKQKEYARKHYETNRVSIIANNIARRKSYKQKWEEFKDSLSCIICGYSYSAALDFHHIIRDKTKQSVNQLVSDGMYKRALEEINKCVVLCSNCHRKGHSYEHKGPPEDVEEYKTFKKFFEIPAKKPKKKKNP